MMEIGSKSKQLEQIAEHGRKMEQQVINKDVMVDSNGSLVSVKAANPEQQFFMAKMYDQVNEGIAQKGKQYFN